jgi:hypothetical protein
MHQPWVVIPLIEELEDAAEDLGLLIREIDPSRSVAHEFALLAHRCEKRRCAENVLVRGEQPAFFPYHQSDDWGGEGWCLRRRPLALEGLL